MAVAFNSNSRDSLIFAPFSSLFGPGRAQVEFLDTGSPEGPEARHRHPGKENEERNEMARFWRVECAVCGSRRGQRVVVVRFG